MTETKQRKRSKATKTTTSSTAASEGTFARHTQEDAALTTDETDDTRASPGMTWLGRLAVFLLFPLLVGLLGLYMAYLESQRQPDRHMNLDRDFVLPFLLALAMVIVIGFQTGGFTNKKVKPLIAWPKVKRVKKIVHKRKDENETKTNYTSGKKDQ